MRLSKLVYAACLASAVTSGCSVDRGVWPDVPDMAPREAQLLAQDMEGPPSFPTVDVKQGKGRVAQYGRRLAMRVAVMDERGGGSGSGKVTVLWPPIERDRLPGAYVPVDVNSGEAPDYFFTCLAGMREGGIREMTLPRTVSPPHQASRRFRDAVSGGQIELPCDREVRLRVELLRVTRPRIALLTTYSIPAMRSRRVVEF